MTGDPRFVIDDELVEFLEGPVAMLLATGDERGRPEVVRAYAARTSEDRRQVSVCIARTHVRVTEANLRANGQTAVVFARVRDYKCYQLKGDDGRIEAEDHPIDMARVDRYLEGFRTELTQWAGLNSSAVDGMCFEHFREVTFTPTVAYVQTPGPSAGLPRTAQ